MDYSDFPKILAFLKNAERLKDTLRSGYTAEGRRESVAAHSWRLCLFASIMHNQYFPHLDYQKLIKMCIIHDLGEAVNGDIPAPQQVGQPPKTEMEERDLKIILQPLPEHLKQEFLELWHEYENASSEEAKLAKALDKMETLIQHNQGSNPKDFDYEFNLDYGRKYTDYSDLTANFRKIIDKETQSNMNKNERAS